MQGLLENKPVLYGLAGTGLVALLGAAQIIPSINENLELVSLPVQVRPSVSPLRDTISLPLSLCAVNCQLNLASLARLCVWLDSCACN